MCKNEKEYIVAAQSGITLKANKGDLIEIVDLYGEQVVDFFAVNQVSPTEYLSPGVTIDCNESLKVTTFCGK
ncbi:DUF1989 domain-containing protein [Vagococcus acidifermentans]|uniref:DUF1989 domain-containing protein n=1 Tax=Vagococcus acidifermentans TaxID=564710 RepID=A0A430AME9_9ENTE|nr:DUF1989 domain-containing protein [Vagococcus acidifermentans]RSU09246.1 hypothetical protein CBF27_13195 [Vagococcus acidifermentans]